MARGGKREASRRTEPRWRCSACKEFHGHVTAGAALRKGKQALPTSHRELVEGEVECSLEFDSVFEPNHRATHRFDYLFIRKADCEVVAVEVHPASSTGNIQELIRKKEGTERILAKERLGVKIKDWHWVVSGQSTVVFTSTDKYGLALAARGIRPPRRKARLDD
jgi:hypothetical protein